MLQLHGDVGTHIDNYSRDIEYYKHEQIEYYYSWTDWYAIKQLFKDSYQPISNSIPKISCTNQVLQPNFSFHCVQIDFQFILSIFSKF